MRIDRSLPFHTAAHLFRQMPDFCVPRAVGQRLYRRRDKIPVAMRTARPVNGQEWGLAIPLSASRALPFQHDLPNAPPFKGTRDLHRLVFFLFLPLTQ